MPKPDESSDGALKRLDSKLDAFEASRTTKPSPMGLGDSASDGFRLLGQILGGVLGGLGVGWLVDHFAGTAPFGVLSGLLIGAGLSVYAAVRQAVAMSARTNTKASPLRATAGNEDVEETPDGDSAG